VRRVPWNVLLALLAGLGLGLAYAWVLSPLRVTNSDPITLRGDFKDQYRSAIAAAYAATGNLPRARARLSLLGDADPVEALNAQAQRMLASGQSFEQADKVAALAAALGEDTNGDIPVPTPTLVVVINNEPESSATSQPPSAETSDLLTETPQSVPTQTIVSESTPRPTQTPISTAGAPFTLTGQDTVCDTNLPDGLLQVVVLSSNRRQLAGAEIVITWDGGEEQFFTGLKPEIGNGYADFSMAPDTTYTVKLAAGSDIAAGLTVPTCQASSGESFFGGIKLTFQQP
jgi:hypothetical protein